MSDGKHFPPSSKRIREARAKGQIVRARSLTVAIMPLSVIFAFGLGLSWVDIPSLIDYWWRFGSGTPTRVLGQAVLLGTCLAAFVIGMVGLVATALGAFQTQALVSTQSLTPDFERVFGSKGWSRVVREVTDSWQKLLRFASVLSVLPWVLLQVHRSIGVLVGAPLETRLHTMQGLAFRVGAVLTSALLVLAGLEYWIEWRRFRKEHGMSLDDLRREHKEDEGDPHIKHLRKSLHERLSLGELEKRVRRSKVIIVARRQPA